MGDSHASVRSSPACSPWGAGRWGVVQSAEPVPFKASGVGEGASGLRQLLPPPFLLLSESFLASFCDQPVLERLRQMANYHNAQSFWGSWVQTQAWPSQEQLHLTQHVEPTLGFTHTPILTFPMGSWWHGSEQMAKTNSREKPSRPAVVSLFQPPSRTAQSWHEAHYPHCIFLMAFILRASTNPGSSILSSSSYWEIWFLNRMMLQAVWVCHTLPGFYPWLTSFPRGKLQEPYSMI